MASFSPFSVVFSNQRFSNCSSTMDGGFVTLLSDCFYGNGLKMKLSSAVTFAAVLLWFVVTILFNIWQSLSLSFCFRPLFLLADDVLPWFVYDIITLETDALDAPNSDCFITDAPAKHVPTICPLWRSEKSPILQYSHCYWTHSVMNWHWHCTTQTKG